MMKRALIVTACLLFFSISGQCQQIKGIILSKAILATPSTFEYEELLNLGTIAEPKYVISFRPNVVGLKHCIEQTTKLLYLNGVSTTDIDRPDIELSYLDSYVDGLNDYGSLHLSLKTESSEVMKGWYVPGGIISLVLGKEAYIIIIRPEMERPNKIDSYNF